MRLPEGLTSRPATADGADAIVELIAACELSDDGAVEIDLEDLVLAFGRVGFDPSTDAALVFDGDLLIGWAEVYRGRAEVYVRPSHRGRGLGAALLAWTEARARALGLAELDQVKTEADEGARDLFLSSGYQRTGESWILRIELERPSPAPEVPTGITIRAYDATTDERAAHRVWEEAISAVWGRLPAPFDVWASQTIAHANFAPELSRVASDGDDVVGTLIAYDFPDAGEVWIGQLATVASYRRRGIAGALLREVFATARMAGRTRCGLSTDSATGARALYERNGMRLIRTYARYTKPLS